MKAEGASPYVSLIGYGMFTAWFAGLMRVSSMNYHGVNVHVASYTIVGFIALFAVLALPSLARVATAPLRSIVRKGRALVRPVGQSLAEGLCMGGATLVLSFQPLCPNSNAVMGAVVIGALGYFLAFVRWTRTFMGFRLEEIMLYGIGSYLVHNVLFTVFQLCPPSSEPFLLVGYAIGSTCLLGVVTSHPAPQETEERERRPVLYNRENIGSLWKIVLGITCYAFVLGMRSSLNMVRADAFVIVVCQTIAISINLLILFWIFALGRRLIFPQTFSLFLILFASCFALFPFVDSIARGVLSSMVAVVTSLISMIIWLAVVYVGRYSSVNPLAVICITWCAYSLPRFLGQLLSIFVVSEVNPGSGAAALSVALLYLSMLITALLFASKPPGLPPLFGPIDSSLSESKTDTWLVDKCQEIGIRCGLSEREVEIIAMLYKNRPYTYIADTLYISKNTVKTHVTNIYTKTKVHNRSDLIKLFESDN
ncbi:response regulator transcription factor [Adlercreutzia sp.]|uniref:response regulator transcription factor n=1 Tax=Adlercreutzia sp. TaxID=1872387 RepID=UPI003AB64C6A